MNRRIRVVLQARTSSSRLPAKALLPMAGIPLALLCARRLGNTGLDVVLATSDDSSDDLLARTILAAGQPVHRGSLHNVLQRFIDCTADLHERDLVVRATADNPFPDGAFVERLLNAFNAAPTDYLCATTDSGLPYGLSAEVFTIAALREAARNVRGILDSEHVTALLRENAGPAGVLPRRICCKREYSHLRVTVDTLEDYLHIAPAFERVPRPIEADWESLVVTLPECGNAIVPRVWRNGEAQSLVTLGTVQLGLNYGIANKTGRPGDDEAEKILRRATELGVTHLDTARAYGDAEFRIGQLVPQKADIKIITKLAPLSHLSEEAASLSIVQAVDASLEASHQALNRLVLDVVMLHRSVDLFRWNGAALSRLQHHVEAGRIRALGVSVYSPEDAIRCLTDRRISYLQIPLNILDYRWLSPSFLQAILQRPDVLVHVRSVFLQGLLLSEAEKWPAWAAEKERIVAAMEHLVAQLGRKSRADLCMAYARSFPWVASMVLGVDSERQLDELLLSSGEPPLSLAEAERVRSSVGQVSQRLLDPSQW